MLHEVIVFELRETEVRDLDGAVVEEDVVWFKISMEDVLLVDVLDTCKDLDEKVETLR